ncbi:MAG TPA: hypothetical protein PKE29_18790 [Phycisphaerales bacterium]|nr:hypothetical protein [Phycisphaerales bacterium]
MRTIPKTRTGRLQFAESHWPVWEASAGALNLPPAQIEAVRDATAAARAAQSAAVDARFAYAAAVLAADTAQDVLQPLLAACVAQIRLTAEMSRDESIYALGEIAPPGAPTPAPGPGTPGDVAFRVLPDGALELSWNPVRSMPGEHKSTRGTYFEVSRGLGDNGPFTLVGTATPPRAGRRGRATFVDTTLPPGTTAARYVITARRVKRMERMGNVFVFQVGGGGVAGAITSAQQKMAA